MLLGVFCPGMHVGMPGYSKSASVGGLGEAASVYSPMRERMGYFVVVSNEGSATPSWGGGRRKKQRPARCCFFDSAEGVPITF